MKAIYQNRFISRRDAMRAMERGITLWIVRGQDEITRWKQYYIDRRTQVRTDPNLTISQRKEILAACEAYEWTADRTVLIKEEVRR